MTDTGGHRASLPMARSGPRCTLVTAPNSASCCPTWPDPVEGKEEIRHEYFQHGRFRGGSTEIACRVQSVAPRRSLEAYFGSHLLGRHPNVLREAGGWRRFGCWKGC